MRIIHLQNQSKLTEKQMGKVRPIVSPKLRPFNFQIKTYIICLTRIIQRITRSSVKKINTAIVLPSLVYPHFKLDIERDEIRQALLIKQKTE